MRRNIVHLGASSLTYAIREIVQVAHKVQELGQEITWENIGDPVLKGEQVPPWIKEIFHKTIDNNLSWGYCDTAGIPATREFLAEKANERGGARLTPDDIMFFNGVGDAVSKIYGFLRREARIIGPTPAYSTHSSAEGAHSGYAHLTYELDPYRNWMPDLEDIRLKIRYNDSITGILLINPDNPTGAAYPPEVLSEIVSIAREFDLCILCDEIYAHVVFEQGATRHLSELVEDVPAIVMRGLSKEIPWPGARCAWLEILNREKDETFNTYVKSLLAAKRLEVCSTTAPQMAIPEIFSDPRYPRHLADRASVLNSRADEVMSTFKDVPGILVNKPMGALYATILFEKGVLNDRQSLKIDNPEIKNLIEGLVSGCPMDQRFVYYLMGATGICVVPLSGFYCSRNGFRITLLECDDAKRLQTYQTIAASIKDYLSSDG